MLWRTNMTKICQIHADKHKILLTTTGHCGNLFPKNDYKSTRKILGHAGLDCYNIDTTHWIPEVIVNHTALTDKVNMLCPSRLVSTCMGIHIHHEI